MKVFITGGTGFIGGRLTEKLVGEGHEVFLLLRDPSKALTSVADKVQYVRGDILNREALMNGMDGCDWVFHLAAYAQPYSKDPSLPYKINVAGTVNVIEAALASGINKLVITSTAGTTGFSKNGKPVDESSDPEPDLHTDYEKTKFEAEKIAKQYSARGMDIIIVNPTRVYGPGRLSKSNSLAKIISMYISGVWRILPGNGHSIGNYVYVDDVADGHILAARSGRSGERYILGGENLSFRDLFKTVAEVSGKERKLIPLPESLMKLIVRIALVISGISGKPPFITREWLDKYLKNWIMSSDKAVRELGYCITPFRTGVGKTINWLKNR